MARFGALLSLPHRITDFIFIPKSEHRCALASVTREIRHWPAKKDRWHFPSLRFGLILLLLVGPAWLHSQTTSGTVISGTIKDPSGAVIASARIEITGGDLTQPVVLSSDSVGNFASPDLKPGSYSLRVTRDGFEPLVKSVDLQGSVQLQLTLAVAKQEVSISV